MCHPIPEVRLRRLAGQLHSLGPRPTFEFLREIFKGADPLERLERYARLDRACRTALNQERRTAFALQ